MLFLSIAQPESIPHTPHETVGLELRLDLFQTIDTEHIKNLLQNTTHPVLLTLRKTSQGGKFRGTEREREGLIEQLLTLNPPLFDLEYDMRPAFLQEMMQRHPLTQFLLSYHDFQSIPADLEEIYHSMQDLPAFSYKIAVRVRSTNEALKVLLFAKKYPKISVVCMGAEGAFARVLGPIVGNQIDYASVDSKEKTGPGQLSEREFMDIYHYPSLNPATAIYGLIGDPIEHSIGHLHHNAVFRKRNQNAVYVKMTVKPEELAEFIPLAKALGMRGLSVTAPLKEAIIPFVDELDDAARQIGAVNTLLFKEGRILGTNTDGVGALDAIENKLPVSGKKVVLLGAGGAARSIAFEAKRRGAAVLVLNRTPQRAQQLAADLGCAAGNLAEVPDRLRHSHQLLFSPSSD